MLTHGHYRCLFCVNRVYDKAVWVAVGEAPNFLVQQTQALSSRCWGIYHRNSGVCSLAFQAVMWMSKSIKGIHLLTMAGSTEKPYRSAHFMRSSFVVF
jgi:hypothetical protein